METELDDDGDIEDIPDDDDSEDSECGLVEAAVNGRGGATTNHPPQGIAAVQVWSLSPL